MPKTSRARLLAACRRFAVLELGLSRYSEETVGERV
jgi:hypothetical protein